MSIDNSLASLWLTHFALVQNSKNIPCSSKQSYLSSYLQQHGKLYVFWKGRKNTFQKKKYFTLWQPIISHEKINKHLYLLGFNFILGLNVISLCFNFIIIHIYHTLKQKKIKFKARIKLNHNIFIKIMQSFWLKSDFCKVIFGSRKKLKREEFLWCLSRTIRLCALGSGTHRICYQFFSRHYRRVVKSSRLPAISPYLVSIGRLFCLAFFYGWRFLNKISLDWRLPLTTQPSTSKLSDNPTSRYTNYLNTHLYTSILLLGWLVYYRALREKLQF